MGRQFEPDRDHLLTQYRSSMVECPTVYRKVAGSSPVGTANNGIIAQIG